MAFSEIDILQILKMFEESSFGELRLENSDVKLLVRKKGCTISAEEPNLEAAPPAMQPITQPMVHQAAGSVASVPEAGLPKATAAVQQGCIPIKSPILGTFYRQPSLDAPPYVEVGSFVKEDDTVCLIEVMKVFTALTAGVRGHIREILADNNSMVEYGQPLFLVEPETTSPGTSA